jgi:hypothetical protein
MSRNWRDLIGGMFLVPALHLGFGLLFLFVRSFLNSSGFFDVHFLGIGIAQFVYLLPVARHYKNKQRFEVVKGISIGAVLTILVNGACFGMLPAAIDSVYPRGPNDQGSVIPYVLVVMMITLSLMVITFYGFNRRGSTTDQRPPARDKQP